MRKNKYAKVKLCRKVNMRINTDVTFRRRFGDLCPSNRTFWLDHALEGMSEGTESSPDFSSSGCTWVSGELGDSDSSSCAGVLGGVIAFFLHTFLVYYFSSYSSLSRSFSSYFSSRTTSPSIASFFWSAPSSLMAWCLRRWERRLLFLFFLGFS
jgi:hypothetical protein